MFIFLKQVFKPHVLEEETPFLKNVMHLCQWKILEMERFSSQEELSVLFKKTDTQERLETLFNEMSASFKKDIQKMVEQEIALANQVIASKKWAREPLIVEDILWPAYREALDFNFHNRNFSVIMLHAHVKQAVLDLRAFKDVGWSIECTLGASLKKK